MIGHWMSLVPNRCSDASKAGVPSGRAAAHAQLEPELTPATKGGRSDV
jgi:hypothetical protein